MEEELNQILSNEELDTEARAEAIKKIVDNNYVPRDVQKKTKDEWKTKYSTLEAEYNKFKEEKMTAEEKQAEYVKQLEKSNKEKETKITKSSVITTFAEAGITKGDFGSDEEYETILNSLSKTSEEEAINFTKALCSTMLNQKKNTENQFKEQIMKGQKKPEGGDNPDDGVTQLDKLKTAYAEAEKNGDMVAMAGLTMQIAQAQNK